MKRELPLVITAIAGLVFAISYFIPHEPFGDAENIFGDWYSIIAAFAIWLGLLNLVQISLQKIARKSEGWVYSLITVISMLIMLVIGFTAVDNSISDGTAHEAEATDAERLPIALRDIDETRFDIDAVDGGRAEGAQQER